jgi:diguanylate cyclase (GGDEF)-like protein
MVLSAAMMFGGATVISLIESLVPGGQAFSQLPGLGALIFVTLLLLVGSRLPQPALAALGPIGAGFIAVALATTTTPGDGAVLYMWPVLWQAYFFGRRGLIVIIASVGIAHGAALLVMADGDLDRWIDVMSAVSVVGAVVEVLSARNRKLLEHISAEARVDELTQLLNRRGFDEGAARELAVAARDQGSIGVALFDLDHFKRVNDEFGHETGDHVLQRFAECLRANLRVTDIAARLGGEEFVALLPGADLEQTCEYTERVRESLSLPAEDPKLPNVTVSAGASAVVMPDNIDVVLKRADMALYAAKARGRDRTVLDDRDSADGSLSGLEIGQYSQHAPMVA